MGRGRGENLSAVRSWSLNRGFGLESDEILGDDIGTAKSEDFSETEIVIHLRAFWKYDKLFSKNVIVRV